MSSFFEIIYRISKKQRHGKDQITQSWLKGILGEKISCFYLDRKKNQGFWKILCCHCHHFTPQNTVHRIAVLISNDKYWNADSWTLSLTCQVRPQIFKNPQVTTPLECNCVLTCPHQNCSPQLPKGLSNKRGTQAHLLKTLRWSFVAPTSYRVLQGPDRRDSCLPSHLSQSHCLLSSFTYIQSFTRVSLLH